MPEYAGQHFDLDAPQLNDIATSSPVPAAESMVDVGAATDQPQHATPPLQDTNTIVADQRPKETLHQRKVSQSNGVYANVDINPLGQLPSTPQHQGIDAMVQDPQLQQDLAMASHSAPGFALPDGLKARSTSRLSKDVVKDDTKSSTNEHTDKDGDKDEDEEDDEVESAVDDKPQSTTVAPVQQTAVNRTFRSINLSVGNDIIENGEAATLRIVDFPVLDPGMSPETGGASTPTAPFRDARQPSDSVLYDSKGVVEILKFCYTKSSSSLSVSSISKFKKNFNTKRDALPLAPSGKPAWVEVNGVRYFLAYAGQIALSGSYNKTHKYKSHLWRNQNTVRAADLSPLMLMGNVDVPSTRVGQAMTGIPKALFEPFNIQPNKSAKLKNNMNASEKTSGKRHNDDTQDEVPSGSASTKRRKKQAVNTARESSADNSGHPKTKQKSVKVKSESDLDFP